MNRIWARLTAENSPWPWIAVACLAVLPHIHVVANPFVFDDYPCIAENPYMRNPDPFLRAFEGNVWSFLGRQGASNYYRPVMHLYNWTIFQFAGLNPGWYHFINLMLHAGVTLMLVVIIRRISGNAPVAFLAGLLFAVHPMHSEVVAWIACSPELLASLFSLITIYLYLKATREEAFAASRVLLSSVMGITMLIALLSKEISALVPVIIASYELLVRRRGPLWQLRHRWLEYGWLTVAVLVYLGLRIWGMGALMPYGRRGALAPLPHLWTDFAVFLRYAALLFWPWDLNYLRFYSTHTSPFEPLVLGGIVSFAAFLYLGIVLYRRRAPDVITVPIYFLTLLPALQLPYVFAGMLVIERALYLPSVAFCWLAAMGLVALARRVGTRPVAVFTAVLLVAFAGRSAVRIHDWRDELGLFREALQRTPDNFHTHSFYGKTLQRHNFHAEAIEHLQTSIRLNPELAETHNTLAVSYMMLGNMDAAWQHLTRTVEIALGERDDSTAARAFSNMAVICRSRGDNRGAIAYNRRAIEFDPTLTLARNNLAFVLLLENQVDAAIEQLRAALDEDPTMWQAHANLGLAFAIRRDFPAALAELRVADHYSPGNPEVQARIGEVHLARGEIEQARQRFAEALRIAPQNDRALAGMEALRR